MLKGVVQGSFDDMAINTFQMLLSKEIIEINPFIVIIYKSIKGFIHHHIILLMR